MLLTPERSCCLPRQKILVSRDNRSQRTHRAENPGQRYEVRHYRLDGNLVTQKKCCDFLLLNDTLKNAYFIELKGGHIEDAIPQLEQGLEICRSELPGYSFRFRIVASKVGTHNMRGSKFSKFKDRYGSALKYGTNMLEESL